MPLSRRDLVLAAVAGFIAGLLFIPVLLNVGVAVPRALLVLVPIFMGAGGAVVGIWVLSQLSRFIPVLFQFGKFLVVGTLNTLLDFGVLNFLSFVIQVYSGGLVALFKAVSFSVAVTNSYFWNKYWTFSAANSKWQSAKRQMGFVRFVLVTLVGLSIGTGTVYGLTTFISPPPAGLSPALWENVANVIAVPLWLTINFLGYKFIVFRR